MMAANEALHEGYGGISRAYSGHREHRDRSIVNALIGRS
jgi:hypothetical protein